MKPWLVIPPPHPLLMVGLMVLVACYVAVHLAENVFFLLATSR
jgi:hypothetical protein